MKRLAIIAFAGFGLVGIAIGFSYTLIEVPWWGWFGPAGMIVCGLIGVLAIATDADWL